MRYTEDMVESRTQLGFNIKQLRQAQRLSQAQLGLMVGLDRSYISRIERGCCNATFDTILLIAGGFGVSPSTLLDGIGEPDQGDGPLPVTLTVSKDKMRRYHTSTL